MGVNTYRVIALTIMIDIILALSFAMVYSANDEQGITYLKEEIANQENWSQDFTTQYPSETPDTDTVYLEQTFGDTKYGGRSFWNLLMRGKPTVPTDASEGSGDDKILQWVLWIFYFFLTILHIYAGLEVFYMFYGKKTGG